MTLNNLLSYIDSLEGKIRDAAPGIVAEEATEYFKERFTYKDWDGTPWPAVKHEPGRGTLMLRSGNLQTSIKPNLVSRDKVIISAGSDNVPYAKVHNEGGVVNARIPVTPQMRKFAWAKFYETGEEKFKGLALTKKTELAFTFTMPQRRFMGHSLELNKRIKEAIEVGLKSI
jgi:phage gpG-like protein